MKKKRTSGQERPPMHTEPVAVRRELAEAYRRQADNRKWTRGERQSFARMGEAWAASLDEQ